MSQQRAGETTGSICTDFNENIDNRFNKGSDKFGIIMVWSSHMRHCLTLTSQEINTTRVTLTSQEINTTRVTLTSQDINTTRVTYYRKYVLVSFQIFSITEPFKYL